MSTVPQRFTFRGVVSEAKRVTKDHSLHFYGLSLLFLFPFCLSIITFPYLFAALSHFMGFHPRQWLNFFTDDPTDPRARPIILLPLLFNLFTLCLASCALGTVAYSTFDGYYDRPVTLSSSIKSLSCSFLPLLTTLVVSEIIVCLVGMVFLGFAALVLTGLEVNSDSIYFWALVILFVLLLVPIILWLQISWSLAYVVVVVESKWGYEALRRSAQLVTGMQRVAASIWLLYGLMLSLLVVSNSMWLFVIGPSSGRLTWIMVALNLVYISCLATEFILQSSSANVVLYIYCKTLHDKVALFEIAEDMPFDGGKVSEVDNVV